MPHALIFGAGKIGRGFIAQLLSRAGLDLYFVDAYEPMVESLRSNGRYHIYVAGNEAENELISMAGAACLASSEWHQWFNDAELVVSCVGAAHLETLCASVANVLPQRERLLNWFICENANKPAQLMRQILGQPEQLALIETQVLRSVMEADPAHKQNDPLALQVHNWWTLPYDADALLAVAPTIPGFEPRENFANELQRKLFTFNGLNGPIAYVGHAHGHEILHEAARDPQLQDFYDQIHEESAHGLIHELACDEDEHHAFQALARAKYESSDLVDPIERHARDTARKLGVHERLFGPALLCLKHGRFPHAYVEAIAAALLYAGSDDPGTQRTQALLQQFGAAAALAELTRLDKEHPLIQAVVVHLDSLGVQS